MERTFDQTTENDGTASALKDGTMVPSWFLTGSGRNRPRVKQQTKWEIIPGTLSFSFMYAHSTLNVAPVVICAGNQRD